MSFVHRLDRVWADVFLLLISYLLYCREILLGCVEVVDRHLVHGNIHYGAVAAVPVSTWVAAAGLHWEVRLTNRRCTRATCRTNTIQHAAAVLLLDLLARLEDRRQQTLILHERAIMMVFAYTTALTAGHAACHVVLEV